MPEGEGEATQEGVGVGQAPVPRGTTTQLISEPGHSTGDRIHKVGKVTTTRGVCWRLFFLFDPTPLTLDSEIRGCAQLLREPLGFGVKKYFFEAKWSRF